MVRRECAVTLPLVCHRVEMTQDPLNPIAEPSLADIVRKLSDQGLYLPGDIRQRLDKWLSPSRVVQIESAPAAAELVAAWRATRSAPRDQDEVWIVLLHLFRSYFARYTPELKAALQAAGMGLMRTRIEVDLQLGGRCFHLGRKLIAHDADSLPGKFLLNETVRLLTEVSRIEQRLSENIRRAYHGQIATSLTILSRRTDPGSLEDILRRAGHHSKIAEELGDCTEEHFAYRAEMDLRLFSVVRDEAILEQAQLAIRRSPSFQTKKLRAVSADVTAELGFARIRNGDLGTGLGILRDAESQYADALSAESPDDVQDGYLLAKRAQVRNQLYRVTDDSYGRRDWRLLNSALADWLDPRAADHLHRETVAVALLDRARVRVRKNDLDGASDDRRIARAMLMSSSSEQAELKLRAADLEGAARNAIAAGDLFRIRELVDEIIKFPSNAPIPAATLAQACKLLVMTGSESDWPPLVVRALDRLEIDLEHPSLTAAARRRIAGHAALLGWFLARRDDHVEQLRRVIQLYRLSFIAMEDPASVDSLSNAGAAALALAKKLLSGDDTDAEEAAGLLADAVSWLTTALKRANANPSLARRDFEPKIVHSRLGEAALRSYPVTWDAVLLDTAIEHLQSARNLGQDAAQLIGLLGDSYYRRGSRHKDYRDLEEALSLKDEAYQVGEPTRENRSVAAATALRMFRLSNDHELLTQAALRALEAALCDPAWPWPILQLAELAASSELLNPEALSAAEPSELASQVLYGQRSALLQRAAALSVRTTEFSASVLGGQQRSGQRGVRVLNDPHRLIEQTIVLKRLASRDAHREHDATSLFRQWLAENAAPSNWLLPEPLSVIDLEDGDSVYVMRRSLGRMLGASVIEWRRGNGKDPQDRFREALSYLAAFHAWRSLSDTKVARTCSGAHRKSINSQLSKICRRLQLAEAHSTLLRDAFAPFLLDGAPMVAKKDPHSGNWLWTTRNELVMIDIESTAVLPLLQEVAVLIDDLPLVEATRQGWEYRSILCQEYLDSLGRFGFSSADWEVQVVERYEVALILHVMRGMNRLRGTDGGVSSFSIESRIMQREHYRRLLDYLASNAAQREVRTLASILAGRA